MYANKPVVFLSFARFQAGYQPTVSLVVTWGGATVFSELIPGEQRYHTFTFNVVGTGSDTLLFTSANDTSYTFLDDVSVRSVSIPNLQPSSPPPSWPASVMVGVVVGRDSPDLDRWLVHQQPLSFAAGVSCFAEDNFGPSMSQGTAKPSGL